MSNTGSNWSVKNFSAVHGPRTHEPVKGYFYDLTADGYTEMPEEHARKFLGSNAFEVKNEKGQVVRHSAQTSKDASGAPQLGPGQVIADLEELTQPALLARASALPDGERLKKNAPKEVLIDFLRGAEDEPDESGEDAGDEDAEDLDDMGEDEVAKMLEDAESTGE